MAMLRLDQLRVKHLKFIKLLAALGTLAATAEQLSMTPSAASMMLKEIESVFGVALFRRKGRGMELTDAGRSLLPRCQTVLGEIDAVGHSLKEPGRPLLRLGAFPHTTTTLLPGILRSLVAVAPAWRVQLIDDRAEALAEHLLLGKIDLMLGRLPNAFANRREISEVLQRVLYQSELAVVARSDHPLSRSRSIPLEELLNWSWVLPGMASTTRVALIDAFLGAGLAPPIPQVESPSYFFSLSLVAQSDFLTCCARSAIVDRGEKTVVLPLKVGIGATPVSLFWRRGSIEAVRAVQRLDSEHALGASAGRLIVA